MEARELLDRELVICEYKRGVDKRGVARAAARCTSGSGVAQAALQERMWTWLDESRRHIVCASGWRWPVHYK